MKKTFGLALAAGLLTIQFASAQNNTVTFSAENSQESVSANGYQPVTGGEDKKGRSKSADMQTTNVYNSPDSKPASEFSQPAAYNRSSGSFTVTKFKESKVARKLKRGEARTRFSVPTPKGKPLDHKKRKSKFKLFN